MQIQPYVGDVALTASSVVVKVDPGDRERVKSLITRTQSVQAITDNGSFQNATRLAGEAKALLAEIENSKRTAKQPFTAVERAIDGLAAEVGSPLALEHSRILRGMGEYVAELERKAKEEQKRKDEAERARQEAINRKLQEAAEKLAKAEQEAREAKDEAERLRAQKDAAQRQAALLQAQIEQEMANEVASMFPPKPKLGFVQGGRVDHPYKFLLTDIKALVQAGGWRLVKWTLDIRACQDAVRSQLETAPHVEPFLPGIKITQEISVSVKASARTE